MPATTLRYSCGCLTRGADIGPPDAAVPPWLRSLPVVVDLPYGCGDCSTYGKGAGRRARQIETEARRDPRLF